MKKIYFVTAISTDSGKTVVSSILTEALQADYWKPIQSGKPYDTNSVKELVSNSYSKFHPSAYTLQMPASPHQSAAAENMEIELDKVELPQTDNHLIIEGAGGVLVPLNQTDFVIDIAQKFDIEIILVSNHYLGSINHTLLTISELKRRGFSIKGIIFNGNPHPETEQIIVKHSQLPVLLNLLPLQALNQESIRKEAEKIKSKL